MERRMHLRFCTGKSTKVGEACALRQDCVARAPSPAWSWARVEIGKAKAKAKPRPRGRGRPRHTGLYETF